MPIQAWINLMCSRISELPEFLDNLRMKVVKFSALYTVALIIMTPRYSLVSEVVFPQDDSAAGKNNSISIPNNKNGIRTREFSA